VIIINTQTGQRLIPGGSGYRLSRMRKRIRAWTEAIKPLHENGDTRLVMVTLTYREDVEWQPNHVRDYLRALRRYVKNEDFLAYAWVAELHKSGKLHYHMYLLVKRGADVPKPDDSGMWKHGLSNIQTGRSPHYLIKYLGKEYQKTGEFPKGIRIFAVWVKKGILPKALTWKFRLSAMPGWLAEKLLSYWWVIGLIPKPQEGGGWELYVPPEQDFENGVGFKMEFISPWQVLDI
jgi:hypothetical protein